MLCQLVIGPCSKLSMTRRFAQSTLADELALGEVTEAELLSAMDWLADRQERIEKALARRHLTDDGFVLYDLSSSYVEGRCCELAALGHSRDGKPGKPQVNGGWCVRPRVGRSQCRCTRATPRTRPPLPMCWTPSGSGSGSSG